MAGFYEMLFTKGVLEKVSWQSTSDIQIYLSANDASQSKQDWQATIAFLISIVLHMCALLIILKPPTQSSLLQPILPMQVSLIKAQENITNAPEMEMQNPPPQIKQQSKTISKKRLPVMDRPAEMDEQPMSQTLEFDTEEENLIVEPIQNSENEVLPDLVPDVQFYEPPKFGVSYLNNPAPIYPEEAKRKRQQGTVMLKVLVKESGKPELIEISESSGIQSLDNAALNAVKKWTFTPAKLGSEIIPAFVIVPIRFNLEKR